MKMVKYILRALCAVCLPVDIVINFLTHQYVFVDLWFSMRIDTAGYMD